MTLKGKFIVIVLFCLMLSFSTTFSIVKSEVPSEHEDYSLDSKQYRDDKSNITNEQLSKIKALIQTAEQTYLSTQLSRIAKVVFDGLHYFPTSYKFWHVFVYANGVKQIGMGADFYQNKWIWFTNYGKYNLTYGLMCDWICGQIITGGSGSAEFGENVNQSQRERVLTAVNNSIIYKGDDISAAAQYLNQKTFWHVIIASPTTKFGYCASNTNYKWASLRSYGDFKWNYYIFA